jgi:hypothetical protein
MSSEKKIKVFFKMQNGTKVSQEVDVNKTVDRMIADFLEKRNLIEKMNDFSFIVNSIPLTKDKFINKKIKYIRQIKPDCIIQVRYIKGVYGSLL